MGSDQVEGIVTPHTAADSSRRKPSTSECHHHHQRSQDNTTVRFQALKCDCHCIICVRQQVGGTPTPPQALGPSSFRSNTTTGADSELLGMLTPDGTTESPSATAAAAGIAEAGDNPTPVAVLGLSFDAVAAAPSSSSLSVSLGNAANSTASPVAVCPFSRRPAALPTTTMTSLPLSSSFSHHRLSASFPVASEPEIESCRRVASPGPCSRYGHSLTEFTPGHFLLFGGSDSQQYFNDVYVLIRGGVASRAISGCISCRPGSRRSRSCCGSADHNSTAIPQEPSSTWTHVRNMVNPPSPRFGHSCHLHHTRDALVFFGGSDNTTWFNDMYLLPLLPTGISRTFERIAPCGQQVAVEGGDGNSNIPDAGESRRRCLCAPCPRRSHTLIPHKHGTCILFGGHSRVSLQDTWVLEADLTWRELATTGRDPCPFVGLPEPRYGHSAVIHDDKMFIFGGFCASGPARETVWQLHLDTLVWSPIETVGSAGPCRRFGHSANLIGSSMVVFGGMSDYPKGRSLSDAHQLNLETMEWRALRTCCDDDLADATGLNSSQPLATRDSDDSLSSSMAPSSAAGGGGGGATGTPWVEGAPAAAAAAAAAVDVSVLAGGIAGRRSHAAAIDSSGNSGGGAVVVFGGWGECAVQDEQCCVEMQLSKPTLRDIARNWIASRLMFPREM